MIILKFPKEWTLVHYDNMKLQIESLYGEQTPIRIDFSNTSYIDAPVYILLKELVVRTYNNFVIEIINHKNIAGQLKAVGILEFLNDDPTTDRKQSTDKKDENKTS